MRYTAYRRAIFPLSAVLLLGLWLVLAAGVEWIGDQIVRGTLPEWVPQFGTPAETILTYLLFESVLSYIVVPILVFTLG